ATVVTTTDNQLDITGGQLSGDGGNLFHSFQQFGLSEQQTANFIANPEVQNVLGRVLGGDASYIDGILRVSNSDANLYLINPAGILFGQNARLDLTGSFTAATADRVGFGDSWWEASGTSDYQQLLEDPDQFSFSAFQPGSVVNLGDLAVDKNQDLTLLGGNVVNTGSVSVPGGQITLASITGPQTVTLGSVEGLLTMELSPEEMNLILSPLSLPQLLTGGNVNEDSGLVVSPDGMVSLQGVAMPEDGGTTAVAGDVAAREGGEVNLLGPRVALVGANVDVSGVEGGGTTRVGGGYQGNDTVHNAVLTYVDADSTINASAGDTGDGGLVVLWADGLTHFYGDIVAQGGSQGGDGGLAEVSGKQNLVFNGTVDLTAPQGQLGQLLLDPTNVVIGTNGADDSELADGIILASDDPGETFFISAGEVESILDSADVEIAATNTISIDETIDASGNTRVSDLTFTASQIDLNRSITLNGGNLTFEGPVLLGFSNADTFGITLDTGTLDGNIAFTDSLNSLNDGEFRRLRLDSNNGNIDIVGTIGAVRAPNEFEMVGNNISLTDYANVNRLNINAFNDLNFLPQQNTTLAGTGIMLRAGNELNLLAANNLTLDDVDLMSSGNITLEAQNLTINAMPSTFPNVDARDDLTLRAQVVTINPNNFLEAGNNLLVEDVDGSAPFTVSISDSTLMASSNIQIRAEATRPANNINVISSELSTGNSLELLAQSILVAAGSQLVSGNDLTLRATGLPGNVTVLDSVGQPTLLVAGGGLTLEGENSINIQALDTPQSVVRSDGDLNLISNSTITADGRFASGGNITAGPGALLFTPVSSGGILSSVGDVSFGSYTGTSLKIEAGGSINGETITITGPDNSLTGTDPDIAWLSAGPSVILRAGVVPAVNTPPSSDEFQNTPNLAPGGTTDREGTTFTASEMTSPGNIEVGDITTNGLPDVAGAVVLSATGSIATGDITTGESFRTESSGSVLATAGGDVTTGAITVNGNNSRVRLVSETGNVEVDTILSRGRDIRISAAGTFQATDAFNVGTLVENNIETNDLPVSLALTRFDSDGMTILYNGATEADPALSNDRIRIGGNGEQFVVGPDVTGQIDPNAGEFIDPIQGGADLRRNETYTPRPLPDDASGTTGGITIGGFGTNGFLSVSVQDIPFVDEVDDVNPPGSVVEEPPTTPDNGPIVMDGEVEIQASEEQVDRQTNASVCNPTDGTLIAQRSLRGDNEESTEDLTTPDVEQIAQRNACRQPDVGGNILVVEDSIDQDGADSER
ncbi:MAG: filamentous hemagglutinin N-terminal domain-containing protein, partial [Cyanobacteria bacterium P01_F01_bin.116]